MHKFLNGILINEFHFSSFAAKGNHSLKVALSLICLSRTSLRAQMKLSLHDICGLPAFLLAGTQAPNIFFGRELLFVLYTFPMYLLVMKLSTFGILQNHFWTCLFIMWHSMPSPIQIPKICLIAVWWKAFSFSQFYSDRFQDLEPQSNMLRGPAM